MPASFKNPNPILQRRRWIKDTFSCSIRVYKIGGFTGNITAEHDTAIAEFNGIAATTGRLLGPELRLPVRLYDIDRHYRGGEG